MLISSGRNPRSGSYPKPALSERAIRDLSDNRGDAGPTCPIGGPQDT